MTPNDAETNKQIVRRYAEDVFVGGNLDAIGETIAIDYVHHSPSAPDVVGVEAMAELVRGFRRSFSEISLTVDDMVAQDDRVATQLRIFAVHSGDYDGIAATGRPVTLQSMAIDRIADGKIAEGWEVSDAHNLRDQILDNNGESTN
jgi:steroid delta-isomerase-like uncharacterized protein